MQQRALKMRIKKEELSREWDYLLSVYKNLNWQGKSVARKRMIEIESEIKNNKTKRNERTHYQNNNVSQKDES